MSKNPKATTPETEVLKTGAAGMILRWTLISLGIGALIGIGAKLLFELAPTIVAVFAGIGILVGLVLGITFAVRGKRRDEESQAKFARPTEILLSARGNIICHGYAAYKSSDTDGRLYLTDKTVEFYNEDLKSKDGNMLIKLRDVRNVDAVKHNTIRIRANDQDYVFVVSPYKASAWKDNIVYAKAAPIVKKPDPAPVVIVEKQPVAQPASETLTTVDFQVKVKTEPGASPEVTSEVTGTETTVTGAAPAADSPKE